MELKSMTDFVLGIRNRTTTELCEYLPKVFTAPKWRGSQDEMVKDILAFDAIKFRIIGDYAKFLKQPLVLGMFVPCDLGGNILEEPIYSTNHSDDCYCTECENETKRCSDEQQKYRQAKERVLFEDMKIIRNSHNFFIIEPTKGTIFYRILKNNTTSTIEDLFKLRIDIMLTNSAIKQLGL